MFRSTVLAVVAAFAVTFAGVDAYAGGTVKKCDSYGCRTYSYPSYSHSYHRSPSYSRYGTTHNHYSRNYTTHNFNRHHHNHNHNYGHNNFNRFGHGHSGVNYGGFNLGNLFVTDGFNGYNGVSGFSHSRSYFNNNRGAVLVRLGGQYVLGSVFEQRVVRFINEITGRLDYVTLSRVKVGNLDFWVQSTSLFHNYNGFSRVVYVPVNNNDFLFSVNGKFFARTGGFKVY